MADVIRFDNPPVIEVVCGAAFGTLDAFKSPYIGQFWKTLPASFSRVEEVPLIQLPGEPFAIEITGIPPMPRVWFISDDELELVQIQRDRFLFNWKRPDNKVEYAEFKNIFPKFLGQLKNFQNFVAAQKLGDIEYRQFELTYVNHIPFESTEGLLNHTSDVLVDHVRDSSRKRFLPEPLAYRWLTSFELPDDKGQIHITGQSAKKKEDSEKILRVDITVRGASNDVSEKGMNEWFQTAHDWIVNGFVDITSEIIQKNVWGRQ